ncbi:MAG: amino acid ABC transporter substrate-binding protein [Ilumatobacteraceae bacterium]
MSACSSDDDSSSSSTTKATGAAETTAASSGGSAETVATTPATQEVVDATSGSTSPTDGESTFDQVVARGSLNCGVNGQLDGFSLNTDGVYSGFDVDYCKAIAAAVLDDPEAVNYVDLTADTRFTALQSGEIDVLIRNGTWTASRDGGLGLQWTTTTFYDGQGLLVRADSEFQALEDLQDTVICVQSGTTTELNLASQFAAAGVTYEPLLLVDEEAVSASFGEEACDAYTTDKSGLASFRASYPDGPEAVRILDVTLSKEPLGPAVREGDDKWFDVVNWVSFAIVQAEEFGLTSENIATAATDNADSPEIIRFIGASTGDAEFTSGLQLPPDFAVRVISAVGNYAEIFERNITPLGLERGLNNLWNADAPGLLYAPPYR